MSKKMVNIYEAKTHLSRLLREVATGTEVVISSNGRPVARLLPIEPEAKRTLGFARGQMVLHDDFDAPLPDALMKGFGG